MVNVVPADLWTVPIVIPGLSCSSAIEALIDTGASVSLIRHSLVPSFSEVNEAKTGPVVGLGGGRIRSLGEVQVSFQLGNVMLSSQFLVVPDSSIKHSMILGVNFFTSYDVHLDMTRHRISGVIDGGHFEIYLGSSGDLCTVLRQMPVRVSKSVKVNNCEPVLVEVLFPDALVRDDDSSYHFVPSTVSPYILGEEGILGPSFASPHVLANKVSGRYSHELLREGAIIGTVSTILSVDCPVAGVNLVTDGTEPVELGDIIDASQLESLNQSQCAVAKEMLLTHGSVFSSSSSDIGCAGVTEYQIELHADTPLRQKPRQFPKPVREELEKQCDELRSMNVIKYSKSPWSAPIVPVRKPDGSIRMCIDYRQLNKVTKTDRFPIPNISDLVFGLHGMQYFSSLDLMKGYYQVKLHPDSTECTAFSTAQNHYEFLRLPFGLKNAPGAFQREMQVVLKSFDRNQVMVYIDDILIMAPTFEEHLVLVDRVLQTLVEHDIKVNAKKCSFFQSEVQFLGHVVGRTGLRKADKFMSAVQEFPKPKTVSDLRSFLGLVNFQRKFIRDCAVIAKPLTRLLGGPDKKCLSWTEEMDKSFQLLRDAIAAPVELAYPDYDSSHRIQLATDASGYGAGAYLSQVQDGEERVIAYASMSFSSAQCQYSTIERELAAIRWAVHNFRGFLYCVPFVLFTDHKPLVYMNNMSNQNARIMRTLNELSEFDFEVRYRPGGENEIADLLSRLPSSSSFSLEGVELSALPLGIQLLSIVPGGGDSLVESLFRVFQHYKLSMDSDFLVPCTVADLKSVLVDDILTHPECYNVSLTKQLRSKLRFLRLPGQVFPIKFLSAVSRCYGLEVWCHHGVGCPVLHSFFKTELPRVHLQCVSGVHFNPVCETSQFLVPVIDRGLAVCHEELNSASLVLPEVSSAVEISIGSLPGGCSHDSLSACMTVSHLGSKTWCTLFDTGAQISLVSESVYRSLLISGGVLSYRAGGVRIVGLGSALSALGIIECSLRFSETNIALPMVLAIVADKLMPFCVILGADFIQLYNVFLCLKTRSFTFSYGGKASNLPFVCTGSSFTSLPEFCYTQDVVCSSDGKSGNLFGPLGSLLTRDQCLCAQRGDFCIRQVYGLILSKVPLASWNRRCLIPFKPYLSKLRVLNDLLWCERAPDNLVVVVPFLVLVDIALNVHWQMGHLGRNKLSHGLQSYIWHPKIGSVVADICNSCPVCQKYKVSACSVSPPIIKIDSDCPFSLLAVDLLQLPKTSGGHVGCLVAVDHYSKWLVVVPIKNKQASTVTAAFEHRVLASLPAKPLRLLSDNGPEFISTTFNALLEKYDIDHVLTTPYKPSSNGAVERVNRTLIERLRCLASSPLSWDDDISKVVIDYNNSWHSTLNMSPSECLLSERHNLWRTPLLSRSTRELWRPGHPSFAPFSVGKTVLRQIPVRGHKVSNKFLPKYDGPYTVHAVRDNGVTYEIDSSSQLGHNRYRVHHSQLREWTEPPSFLKKHPTFLKLVSGAPLGVIDDVEDEPPHVLFSDDYSSDDDHVVSPFLYSTADEPVKSSSPVFDCSGSDSDYSFDGFDSELLVHVRFDSERNVPGCTDSVPASGNSLEISLPVGENASVSFSESDHVSDVSCNSLASSTSTEFVCSEIEVGEGGKLLSCSSLESLPISASVESSRVIHVEGSCVPDPCTGGSYDVLDALSPSVISPLAGGVADYFWDEYLVKERDSVLCDVIDNLAGLENCLLTVTCDSHIDSFSTNDNVSSHRSGCDIMDGISELTVDNESVSDNSCHIFLDGSLGNLVGGLHVQCTDEESFDGFSVKSASCSFEGFVTEGGHSLSCPGISKDRLSSLQNVIRDCRSSLEELQRREKARAVQQSGRLSPGSGENLTSRLMTRSRGPVMDLPHVQDRILERRRRR